MPATGNLTSELLEVMDVVTLGVFTDVTDWIDGNVPPRCTEGRSSRFDDDQPGRFELTLQNYDGRWTPDNPASPYAGRWRRGVVMRYSVAKTSFLTSSILHYGRVIDIRPSVVDGVTSWAVVQVTSVDTRGALATRDMACDFVERWQASERGGYTLDLWPFDEGVSNPTTVKNLSVTGGRSGTVYRPATQVGSITTESPDGIDLDGSLSITAADTVGPIVSLPVSAGTVLDCVVPFRTSDRVPAGGPDRWIVSGRDASSSVLWSVRLKDNGGQTDVNLYDATGAFVATLYYRFAPPGDDSPGDDQWFAFRIGYSAGSTFVNFVRVIDDKLLAGFNAATIDVRGTTEVVLGGQAHRFAIGKQVQCSTARFGAVAVANGIGPHIAYLQPEALTTMAIRIDDLELYCGITVTVTGTANPDVIRTRMSGRKAFDVLTELARTVGGLIRRNYLGTNLLVFVAPDSARSATPLVTIDAVTDLDATQGVETADSVDTRPTRVTVAYPGGSVVVVGDETNGRIDGSLQTCAVSEDHARSIGGAVVNAGTALAFTRIAVDLTTCETNLWAVISTLRTGDRIRLASTPTDIYGRTYQDLYVLGYVVETPHQGCTVTFDTEPADSPAEGRADDAVYGRASAEPGAMTITGGTAVGTTASGTVIVTTASGPTLSTDSADYPLDLNWNGERITAPTAPATSTSPQTLTGVTRGVAPSIVRTHVAGEAVDVWFPATATF